MTNVFQSGGSNNWNNTLSWSQGSVPTASDGFVTTFNASSPNCTVNVAAVCNSIDFTLYTNTITWTNNITVSGAVTLGSGMLGSSTTKGIVCNATATLTSNGLSVPFLITFNAFTFTLAANWTTTGGVFLNGSAVINSNNLNINGGTFTANSGCSGTATIVFGTTGNMTWTGSGWVQNNVTINTSGTLTIASGTNGMFGTGTMTYTAGTVVTTGNTFTFQSSNYTLNTNGMSFNNVLLYGGGTTTINSLLTVTGSLLFLYYNAPVFAGTAGWTCATLGLSGSAGSGFTLKSGNTYTVTTSISQVGGGDAGSCGTIKSSTTSSAAYFNYSGPNSGQSVLFMNFTDIDASGGNTIWDYPTGNVTFTRTVNINTRPGGSYIPQPFARGNGA